MTPTPTLASVQAELLDRVGRALAFVGKDGTTALTPNAGLASPIALGLRLCGIVPAGTAPADDDFLPLRADDYDRLIDMAEVRALESVLNALTGDDTTYQLGINRFDLSDYQTRLERTIARLWAQIKARYGIGRGTLSGGTVDVGFAEPPDPTGSEFAP